MRFSIITIAAAMVSVAYAQGDCAPCGTFTALGGVSVSIADCPDGTTYGGVITTGLGLLGSVSIGVSFKDRLSI